MTTQTHREQILLTRYCRGSGCGCKIAPAVLSSILSEVKSSNNDLKLLVGNETADDAAVYDMSNGTSLISTTDFFMPVVDDAFDFGRIAAANALSDVYAMGGKPFLALSILGFPVDKIPAEVAGEILKGAKQVCEKAGVSLAGGHSIESPEPFFGLSVNGTVATENIKRNITAQPGDLLFLTKPLGTGIILAAAKRNLIDNVHYHAAIEMMTQLNNIGEKLGECGFVNAMTDVTGFGLLGHLIELCEGSNVSSELYFEKIPLLNGAAQYASQFIYPDLTMKTYTSLSSKVSPLTSHQLIILCDPQTNGGLLVAVNPAKVDEFLKIVGEHLEQVGVVVERKEKVVMMQ